MFLANVIHPYMLVCSFYDQLVSSVVAGKLHVGKLRSEDPNRAISGVYFCFKK